MDSIETLEFRIIKLRDKNKFRIERMKRYRELGLSKYNDFDNGKIWGAYQAYSTILGIIKKLKTYGTEI